MYPYKSILRCLLVLVTMYLKLNFLIFGTAFFHYITLRIQWLQKFILKNILFYNIDEYMKYEITNPHTVTSKNSYFRHVKETIDAIVLQTNCILCNSNAKHLNILKHRIFLLYVPCNSRQF